MTCMDCHQSAEMHASATAIQTRMDLRERPICESCHSDSFSADGSNRSHAIHRGRLACQVCHAQAAKSCFRCHVGTDTKGLPYYRCEETRIQLKIGLNPFQSDALPPEYVVVRHPPVTPQTFGSYVKNGLSRFNDLPTWKPSFPHNIRRITPQNKNCNNCHGNPALFLSLSDLAPWEIAANKAVVVPSNRVPVAIEDDRE